MDVNDQLDEILPGLTTVASRISPDQMANQSPCANFDVRGLFNHLIGGATAFAAQFRGEEPPAPPPPGTDLAGAEPYRNLRAAIDSLAAAMKSPGALDRTIVTPFGALPGAFVAQFLTVDGMVHTWDLATATGQAYAPDDALAGEVLAFAQGAIAPELRDGDTFAAAVQLDAGASNLDQLVAFTGRDPRATANRSSDASEVVA